jgi:hypothetical protein
MIQKLQMWTPAASILRIDRMDLGWVPGGESDVMHIFMLIGLAGCPLLPA